MNYSDQKLGENITVDEAWKMIDNNIDNEDFIILDVRTPQEYETGYIRNSVLIDCYSESFLQKIKQINPSKKILLYCKRPLLKASLHQTSYLSNLKIAKQLL